MMLDTKRMAALPDRIARKVADVPDERRSQWPTTDEACALFYREAKTLWNEHKAAGGKRFDDNYPERLWLFDEWAHLGGAEVSKTTTNRKGKGDGGARRAERDAEVTEAIRRASRELIAEIGPDEMTLQKVADRASKYRPTVYRPMIYRRWTNLAALIAETSAGITPATNGAKAKATKGAAKKAPTAAEVKAAEAEKKRIIDGARKRAEAEKAAKAKASTKALTDLLPKVAKARTKTPVSAAAKAQAKATADRKAGRTPRSSQPTTTTTTTRKPRKAAASA